MSSTIKAERADAAVRQLDPFGTDQLGSSICFSNSNSKRGVQLRCEACGKRFNKSAGPRKRFCSDPCRAAQRREEGRNTSEAQSSIASGNALIQQTKSIACNGLSKDPYPTPIDLLGRGCRWPADGRLDRETWQKILWREVGAP